MRLFVSYARVDKPFCKQVVLTLADAHEVWYDQRLHAGDEWWEEIKKRLRWCDAVLYLLSPESVASEYCQKELEIARSLGKIIIPVLIQARTPIPIELQNIHYADLSEGLNVDTVGSLLNAILMAERRTGQSIELPTNVESPQSPTQVSTQDATKPPSASKTVRTTIGITAVSIGLALVVVLVLLVSVLLSRRDESGATVDQSTLSRLNQTSTSEALEIARFPSPTTEETPNLTPTPSVTPTATDDLAATQAADFQATLTALAVLQAQGAQTATAEGGTRAASSQLDATLRSAADTATAGAIAITQAVLAETATQQSVNATATRAAGDFAGTQLALASTATADAWTDTPTPPTPPASTLPPTSSATSNSPIPPVTRNADWTPVERDFDGVTMVLVPPGCFMMGSDDGDADEQPVHQQCFVVPFWIDKTEVTQADFERLGGVKSTPNRFDGAERPVESVTWFEARAFCAIRMARLPTESEWEYTARGPDALTYPWGNTWNTNHAVWNRFDSQGTANVGRISVGRSWVGALDMSGNVLEWVSSLYLTYESPQDQEADTGASADVYRVLRGGAWISDASPNLRAADRARGVPVNWGDRIGFRCTRDYAGELDAQTASAPSPTAPPVANNMVYPPVTRNADWTPVERDFDGVTMVLVPPGCFMMGSDEGDPDEQPVNQQCFDQPFWIDKTEVTQGDFARLNGQKEVVNQFSGDSLPVDRITWFEARDFCMLRRSRLPTEAEWEYAARGPDSLTYPWGNEPNDNNAFWIGNSLDQTHDVGTLPGGRSWVRAFDMSGNVWEWTSSILLSYPYREGDGREDGTGDRTNVLRVLRGGAWDSPTFSILRAAGRNGFRPNDAYGFGAGFRCTRDYAGEPISPIATTSAVGTPFVSYELLRSGDSIAICASNMQALVSVSLNLGNNEQYSLINLFPETMFSSASGCVCLQKQPALFPAAAQCSQGNTSVQTSAGDWRNATVTLADTNGIIGACAPQADTSEVYVCYPR
jgi:formylglycine-generating enzyme required for sulfatase activity